MRILQNRIEIVGASQRIKELGLRGHHDPQKNWDLLLSIDSCLSSVDQVANILDAGAGYRAHFARSMRQLGYKKVYACDMHKMRAWRVVKSKQDLANTNYPDGFFSFIACHSVIEHGIDPRKFFVEMFRISNIGAVLSLSTDFWPQYEDHSDKFPYGPDNPPMMLFNTESLGSLLDEASRSGWLVPKLKVPVDIAGRPIHWERMNSAFTFAWMQLVKPV